MADLRRDRRAVSPTVAKALEASIVVLFLAATVGALYGGAVPEYRTATATEVADRTLVTGAHRLQQAVPPNGTVVDGTYRVSLPSRIHGESYAVRPSEDGRRLSVDHPDDRVTAGRSLALPDHVVTVDGVWYSTRETGIAVESVEGGVRLRLTSGDPR